MKRNKIKTELDKKYTKKTEEEKQGVTRPKEYQSLPALFINEDLISKICEEAKREGRDVPTAAAHVTRAIIHMASFGMSNKIIAKKLGLTPSRVAFTLGSESAKAEVKRLETRIFGVNFEQMFRQLLPTAAQTVFDLMIKKTNKDSTRLEAAKYLIDRSLGKPKEIIEQKTDLIAEVFQSLSVPKEKTSQKDLIEAEFEKVDNTDSPKDPLEEILDTQ